MSKLSLGKLERTHSVAPAYIQRAVVVCVAAFICFLVMMGGFYIRQNIGYFLLSTAFLIVYVLTMFSLVMLKRSVVNVYENGISYKKFRANWHEIASARMAKDAKGKNFAEIIKKDDEKIVLSDSIENIEKIVEKIKENSKW